MEHEVPYVAFVKLTGENGRVTWKKYPKASPTRIQTKKIKALKAEQTKLLPTEEKRLWFYYKIDSAKKHAGRRADLFAASPLTILVERSYFLRDSFEQFRTIPDLDLRKEIKIHFIDEICQDAGGLIREWFTVLIEELFSPTFGLFVKTNTHNMAYTINPNSEKLHKDHELYYLFCGQILAKALFEKITVKAYLAKFLFKKLTLCNLVPEDMKYYDEEIWSSLSYIHSNKIESDSMLTTFSVMKRDPESGKEYLIDLIPGGSTIPVKDENKNEFIEQFTKYHLISTTEKQFNEMASGFYDLIPLEMLQVLDCDELELFLCGESEIVIPDWRENTKYKGTFNDQHPVIKWFWDIITRLSSDEIEKFLQFCTGSSRPPAEGFKGLMSNNGKVCPFCIEPRAYVDSKTSFLIAHTCFNRLELPLYPDMKSMEEVIKKIISTPICYQFSFE